MLVTGLELPVLDYHGIPATRPPGDYFLDTHAGCFWSILSVSCVLFFFVLLTEGIERVALLDKMFCENRDHILFFCLFNVYHTECSSWVVGE